MRALLIFTLFVAMTVCANAQNSTVKRPRITGLDHFAFYTTAPEKVQELYTGTLGLVSAPSTEPGIKWRYNIGSQWVGYSPAPDPNSKNRFDHMAFVTDDIEALRRYLQEKGVKPGNIQKLSDGDRMFAVNDPDGHKIEFVQRAKPGAKPAPVASACSNRLMHTGLIMKDRTTADHFYRDILGFRLYWQGGMHEDRFDWVSMQVPDGTDWFEYMLNINPDADQRLMGVMNHLSFGVANMDKAEAILVSHGWKPHGDEHQQIGKDGKKQLNLFDADLNRVELMEFAPVQKPCCSEFQLKHPSEND